jgi:hypothetical protein
MDCQSKINNIITQISCRLYAEGVTGKNYTSFRALRVLRKCVMGRKLVCYLISGNEIKVQQRLSELSQIKQINATESLPYINQQFTAKS